MTYLNKDIFFIYIIQLLKCSRAMDHKINQAGDYLTIFNSLAEDLSWYRFNIINSDNDYKRFFSLFKKCILIMGTSPILDARWSVDMDENIFNQLQLINHELSNGNLNHSIIDDFLVEMKIHVG